MFNVIKPFHTVDRRFAAGDQVAPDEIHGAVTFDVWVARGFIAADKPKLAKETKREFAE